MCCFSCFFCFCFCFKNFEVSCGFWGAYCCLEFVQLLEYRFMSFAKFKTFSDIIFSGLIFLSLPMGPQWCKTFCYSSTVPWGCLVCWGLFCFDLSLIGWVISIILSSSLLVVCSVPFILLLSPSVDFISILYFLVQKFLLNSTLCLLFLSWEFLFYKFASRVFVMAHWSIFMLVCLRLSNKFNISYFGVGV